MIEAKDFREPFRKVMFRYLPDSEEAAPVVAAMMTMMYLDEVSYRYAADSFSQPDTSLKEWTAQFEEDFWTDIKRMLKILEKSTCK